MSGTLAADRTQMLMPPSNHPTVSDEEAMRRYPQARAAERDALLDLVTIAPGDTVLDVQAAGGFLADEVYRRFGDSVTCICLEPTSALRTRIDPRHRTINDPVESFHSLRDRSMTVVLGLAGLHHSTRHLSTLSECYRVLRPGGSVAMCDVLDSSQVARWLNTFVDRYNPQGHKGNFLETDKILADIYKAGFDVSVAETVAVPWRFTSRADICLFFKGLFGLTCTERVIDDALDDYFCISRTDTGVIVDWELYYFCAARPD